MFFGLRYLSFSLSVSWPNLLSSLNWNSLTWLAASFRNICAHITGQMERLHRHRQQTGIHSANQDHHVVLCRTATAEEVVFSVLKHFCAALQCKLSVNYISQVLGAFVTRAIQRVSLNLLSGLFGKITVSWWEAEGELKQPEDTAAVISLHSPVKWNVFSFILITIGIAPPHCGHQNYIRTHMKWWKK